MRKIKIFFVALLCVMLLSGVGYVTWWGIKYLPELLSKTGLYTYEQLQESYNQGKSDTEAKQQNYEELVQQLENYKSQIFSLQNQSNLDETEILRLVSLTSSLNARIDLLEQTIINNASLSAETVAALQGTISNLNQQISTLQFELLAELSAIYNNGFADGQNSIDVDRLYEDAYNKGYDDGYNQIEKELEEQNANKFIIWSETDTTWFEGENSTYNSALGGYLIYNANQLAGLAQLVNNGNNFDGKKVYLANNIYINSFTVENDIYTFDFSNSWVSIGTEQKRFSGTFNGGDFTVFGLTNSLFGVVQNAEIKNINFQNSNLIAGAVSELGMECVRSDKYLKPINAQDDYITEEIIGLNIDCIYFSFEYDKNLYDRYGISFSLFSLEFNLSKYNNNLFLDIADFVGNEQVVLENKNCFIEGKFFNNKFEAYCNGVLVLEYELEDFIIKNSSIILEMVYEFDISFNYYRYL